VTSANLEVVRSIYAAWARGDFSSADWADPEIEFTMGDGPAPGTWKGRAEMAKAWGDYLSAYEDFRAAAEEIRELDEERVLVLIRNSGQGKASGLDVEQISMSGANLLHLRDGKVTRLVAYWHRERAFAELGLGPAEASVASEPAASPSLFSLAGRTALVTGASRGIGREIALAYADAGADVAVLSRSRAELDELADGIRERGRTALALPCDVTDRDQIAAAVDQALGELEKIDILVNNAGGPLFNAPFLEIRPEGWRRALDLNLLSVVGFCQTVGAHMVKRSSGSIINIDSIGAAHPGPFVSPYCAAKAAVVNLTKVLAQEWGSAGVRINSVSPGWVRTEINQAIFSQPALAESIARRVPLRRWGEPGDVVGVAVWLASDASSYVSGAHIPIDGGVSVVAPQAPSGPSGWA
jgi:NAD(P)-dependent dehydrogenase (short-subunit alcohol dehydrogenase family)/ketosteroid isomerase-like protein